MRTINNKNLFVIICILVCLSIVILSLVLFNSIFNNKSDNEETDKVRKEEIIVEHFEEITEDNDETNIDKGYKEIVDFIFNDKKINGISFKELEEDVKIKILSIGVKIDSKIDELFPNYKDNINEKYKNIKDKLSLMLFNITSDICNENKNMCDKTKEIYNDVKEEIVVDFNKLKEISDDEFNKVVDFIKDYLG